MICVSRIEPSADVHDEVLARAFERRDAAAYESAYQRFGARLYGAALRVLGDRESASECVHDVFLQLWRRGGYVARRGRLEAFLLVCVRNRALMTVRGRARGSSALKKLDAPVQYSVETDVLERARIDRALSRLTSGQAEVVELAYYRGFTLAEVATELAIPIGTVKTRLSAALRALRATLVESPDGV